MTHLQWTDSHMYPIDDRLWEVMKVGRKQGVSTKPYMLSYGGKNYKFSARLFWAGEFLCRVFWCNSETCVGGRNYWHSSRYSLGPASVYIYCPVTKTGERKHYLFPAEVIQSIKTIAIPINPPPKYGRGAPPKLNWEQWEERWDIVGGFAPAELVESLGTPRAS